MIPKEINKDSIVDWMLNAFSVLKEGICGNKAPEWIPQIKVNMERVIDLWNSAVEN